MKEYGPTKLATIETDESMKTRAAMGQLYGLLHKANARRAEKAVEQA